MNAGSLLEFLRKLVRIEEEHQLQARLQTVISALNNLVNNPNDQNYQRSLADEIAALQTALNSADAELTPADWKRLEELRARQFFGPEIGERIATIVSETGMIPAVAQRDVAPIVATRQDFVSNVPTTVAGMERLGISTDTLDAGEAEVGFQLPREIFDNELTGLIQELRALRRIIRSFSEFATGSAEEIEIRQISTSDPNFWFGLSPDTVAQIGKAISWALDQLKKLASIRKIRNEAAKIDQFFTPEMISGFDSRIHEMIEKAIDEKVKVTGSGIRGRQKPDARVNSATISPGRLTAI